MAAARGRRRENRAGTVLVHYIVNQHRGFIFAPWSRILVP